MSEQIVTPLPPQDGLDLKLLSCIREGNLDGVKEVTSGWSETDYPRLKENHVYPLHLATCFGHTSLVQFLVDHTQLDINQQNQEGSTAIHLASAQNHLAIVDIFIKKDGLDVLLLDSEGKTAIDRAQNDSIKTLLLDYQKKWQSRVTTELLSLGRSNKFPELINRYEEFKIGRLVPINIQCPETGRTLLHWATLADDEKAVKWLLHKHADVEIKDNDGILAYDLAKDERLQALLIQGAQKKEGDASPRLEGTLKKWTNLASGYKERYFILEDGKLSYFKSHDDIDKASRGTIMMKNAQINWKDGSNQFEVVSIGHLKLDLRADHVVEAKKWVDALISTKRSRNLDENSPKSNFNTLNKHHPTTYSSSYYSRVSIGTIDSSHISELKGQNFKRASQPLSLETSYSEPHPTVVDIENDYSLKATLMSIGTHSDVQKRMLESTLAENSNDSISIPVNTVKTLLESIQAQKNLISDTINLDTKRETLWHGIYQRQLEEQTMWRNNLETLAKEHNQLESLVKNRSKLKKFQKAGRAIMAINALSNASSKAVSRQSSENNQGGTNEEPEACFSENEDSFFDAEDDIDASIAENYTLQKKESQPILDKSSPDVDPIHDVTSTYVGYPQDGKFRTKLEMSGDIIPDISIWSILKNSVGKDLSKIAVPVEFNEPTSMLQRMCEDMEYSELLDIAVQQPESIDRILWVAAFAISNYSSTLGRTGKPFNPLLGETFEYVRPDRGFRYISEQVSHHPPISACYCESPNYLFQAEVNLISKFWGKSFELNPQGVTHLFLKLPTTNDKELKSDTDSTSSSDAGIIQEHYTWTKVTSAMNNIIIGTMYIEHYGDMVIKNHRTGEECALTFHQTGWRSSNKHVVRGVVRDANGREVWEIGGRWDDKLVARRMGLSGGDLVDKVCDNDQVDQSIGSGSQPVLLWKMTPKPKPHLAYQLTHFAVTLNEMTEGLQHHLPPTDSRHRPDQKAMERGDFKAANDLKVELENRQRQRRKANPNQTHKPRWFSKGTDPDTQSTIWAFDSHYWSERYRCGRESFNGSTSVEWDNVTKIFE